MGAENQTKGRVSRRPKRQAPGSTCSTCPGGEDHLKRRSSSPPVPPLLGCRHCPKKNVSVGFAANHGFNPRECKGRSPLHEITLILPLPAGKGGGGMGAGKKTKGRVGRRQTRQAPPTDSGTARSAGDQPGKPPAGHLHRRFSPCRFRFRRGDARGGAPCIRKLKISPFPGGEGGWGQERKLKAG